MWKRALRGELMTPARQYLLAALFVLTVIGAAIAQQRGSIAELRGRTDANEHLLIATDTSDSITAAQGGTWSVEATVVNTPTVSVDNLGPKMLLGQGVAFSVATAAFTPAATPTDLCVIGGVASTTIKIIDARLTGTATAATTVDVDLVKRSTANTSGTFVAGTVVPHDSTETSAAPTVGHYTANPTTGTAVGTLLSSKVLLPIAGTVASPNANQNLLPPGAVIELRGTAQQLAINFGGAALPAGAASWRCHFSWIENTE